MSLGFTGNTASEMSRRAGFNPQSRIDRRMSTKGVTTSATSSSDSIPVPLRVEALELAVATLSDQVTGLDGRINEYSHSAHMQTVSERLGSGKLGGNVFGQSSGTSSGKDLLEQRVERLESSMHLRATIMQNGSPLFTSASGTLEDSMAGNESLVAEGTVVRLLLPQHQLPDGRVMMSCIHVHPDTMVVTTGWLVVFDTNTHARMVHKFTV